MRIACVFINNLAVGVALRGHPEWRGQPVIIGGLPFEEKTVFDASPEASACGVRSGMPLREAAALCPEARFLLPEERKYEQAFAEVMAVLECFSPAIDVEDPGCAYLDVTGVQDEAGLASDIVSGISAGTGLATGVGISNSKFLSRAAACVAKPVSPAILSAGQEKSFIAPFSVDLLPCSNEARERLHFLGIRRIGQLSQFRQEMLAGQFGAEGIMLYNLSHGIDRTPFIPRRKPETAASAIEFDPPAVSYMEIAHGCAPVLARLMEGVKSRGKLCREVVLGVSFADASTEEARLPLQEATPSGEAILRRLATWLEGKALPSPVTAVCITLLLTGESGKRASLWPHGKVRQEFGRLTTELKTRFGYQPLKRIEMVDSSAFVPERRFALRDVDGMEAVDDHTVG